MSIPNSEHIERVVDLFSRKSRSFPSTDYLTYNSRPDMVGDAYDRASTIVANLGRRGYVNISKEVMNTIGTTFSMRFPVYCAIYCLAAYDDCAYMLDSNPDELAILAALGDDKAILLLPVCKAIHTDKTESKV